MKRLGVFIAAMLPQHAVEKQVQVRGLVVLPSVQSDSLRLRAEVLHRWIYATAAGVDRLTAPVRGLSWPDAVRVLQ